MPDIKLPTLVNSLDSFRPKHSHKGKIRPIIEGGGAGKSLMGLRCFFMRENRQKNVPDFYSIGQELPGPNPERELLDIWLSIFNERLKNCFGKRKQSQKWSS